MMNFFKELDLWEAYPSFYYSLVSKSFKSYFNGIIFMFFSLFSIGIFIMQFILFVQDADMVISSRTEDEKLDKVSISSYDALYGVGFYEYLNDTYSYFPQSLIDEYLFLNYTLLTNSNFSYPSINYETCNAENFYDPLEWADYTESFRSIQGGN